MKSFIKIHPTVLIAVIYFMVTRNLFVFGFILFFVTIHEAAHMIFGFIFGAEIKSVLITPIGERAVIEGIEYMHPFKRFIIYFSGPFVSLFLGIFFKLVFSSNELAILAANTNVCIGVFNLIPLLPLDGGEILFIFADNYMGNLKAAKLMTLIGKYFSVFMVILGIVQAVLFQFNISLLIIGLYIFNVNKKYYCGCIYKFYKKLLMQEESCRSIKFLMFDKEKKLGNVVKHFSINYFYIVVYENDGILEKADQYMIAERLMNGGIGLKLKNLKNY